MRIIFLILLIGGCNFSPPQKVSVPPDPRCASVYQHLYQNDVIEIRVIFGYKDSRPARFVSDRYERNIFIQKLNAMGFARDPKDDDVFLQDLNGQDGKTKKIRLTVVSSAAGPDDEENQKDPYQKWKSEQARETFLRGLVQADVVFYDGHSRNGGGPDFASPHTGASGHVDYAWYQHHRPGFKEMIGTFKKNSKFSRLQLLGLFSCISGRHFSQELLQAKPGMGMIVTDSLIYSADALEEVTETLHRLLMFQCAPGFVYPNTQ